jgi:hypothetical protein
LSLPRHSDSPSLYYGFAKSIFMDVKNDFAIQFTNTSYHRYDGDNYEHYDRGKIIYTNEFRSMYNSCCNRLKSLTNDKFSITTHQPVDRFVSWSIFLILK